MRLMNRREWDNKNGIGVLEIMGMRLINRREWDNQSQLAWDRWAEENEIIRME